jgi:hypothetical protein
VTPNLLEAQALAGDGRAARAGERLHELGARGGDRHRRARRTPVDHLFDGERHVEIRSSATTSPRRTGPAARTPPRSRRCSRAGLRLEEARAGGARRLRAVAHGLAELGAATAPST